VSKAVYGRWLLSTHICLFTAINTCLQHNRDTVHCRPLWLQCSNSAVLQACSVGGWTYHGL